MNRKKNSPQVLTSFHWPFVETFFMLYFIAILMQYHDLFFRFIYLSMSPSLSVSQHLIFSLSSFLSASVLRLPSLKLSLFSLSVSLSVSVSYTLLFLPSSCSSPEAFLFFSFFLSFYGCDRKSSCHTADWFRSSHPDCVFSELWPHDCKSAPLLTVWPPLKSLGSLKGISGTSIEDFGFK